MDSDKYDEMKSDLDFKQMQMDISDIFSRFSCSSTSIFWSSMLIFCSSSLRRSNSSASREEVEAELSICICLKSRSDFISSYLSESMPLALVRCSFLRETVCSRRT